VIVTYEVEHVRGFVNTNFKKKKKKKKTYPETALMNFSLTSGPALLGTKSDYSGFCHRQRAMDDEGKTATY
jgi:hypothetical protein